MFCPRKPTCLVSVLLHMLAFFVLCLISYVHLHATHLCFRALEICLPLPSLVEVFMVFKSSFCGHRRIRYWHKKEDPCWHTDGDCYVLPWCAHKYRPPPPPPAHLGYIHNPAYSRPSTPDSTKHCTKMFISVCNHIMLLSDACMFIIIMLG